MQLFAKRKRIITEAHGCGSIRGLFFGLLQEYANKSACTLVDYLLERFSKPFSRIGRHMSELCTHPVTDKII